MSSQRRFLFQLALALGKTVFELERTMPATELTEWMQFYAADPFGELRADLRAGVISQTIARVMGGNKQARPIDYMPIIRKQREEDAALDEREIATRFNAMMFALSKGGVKIGKRSH